MGNKQFTNIIKAMLYASTLSPQFDDDYYENLNPTTMAHFIEGLTAFFGVDRDWYMFHFCNLNWLDTPSETLEAMLSHKEKILENFD